MEITSYFHPRASFLTPAAICWGVSVGPEANSRCSSCPVARVFTWVPPMSTTRTFTVLARLPEVGALGDDHLHELVPGFHEGLRSLILELGGQRVDVDPGLRDLRQNGLGVTAVGRQDRAELPVVGEGFEGALWHRVHGERRGERLDVEDVGCLRVLRARAGPQRTLRAGACVVGALPARRAEQVAGRLVRVLGDRDAQLVAERRG